MNSLIYGMPTSVTDPPPGFNMYRVRFNGDVMELEENISETTDLAWECTPPFVPLMRRVTVSPMVRRISLPGLIALQPRFFKPSVMTGKAVHPIWLIAGVVGVF